MWLPSTEEVLAMHASIIDDAPEGVPRIHGVRHRGAVDAALARAEWGPFSGTGDLAERAAFLLRGIAQDHPFADGNKRTAFQLTDVFLRRNGHFIESGPVAVVDFMLAVARGELDIDAIAAWLRTNTRKA